MSPSELANDIEHQRAFLEEVNGSTRWLWKHWRSDHPGEQMPPAIMIGHPAPDDQRQPFAMGVSQIGGLPSSHTERKEKIFAIGEAVRDRQPDTFIFFLCNEAWAATTDTGEIPEGPVREMDGAMEIVITSGMDKEGRVYLAKQKIMEDDKLGEPTYMVPNDENGRDTPLLRPFWHGFRFQRN